MFSSKRGGGSVLGRSRSFVLRGFGVLLTSLLLLVGAVSPASAEGEDFVRSAEYWLSDYQISRAWEVTRGAGVTVAVLDTGIAQGLAELDAAVVGGTDVSGVGDAGGRLALGDEDGSHGSWVASLIAAQGTGPDAGMIGVAPDAKLLSVSIDFSSSAQISFDDQVADGIRWAVDNGADVINLSFTTNTLDWSERWDDAFQYAFDHDVVVIAAAGNRGSGTERVGAPATIPGVLTVGGVDTNGVASVSSSTQGITIGVVAPSEELLGISKDGQMVIWSGTSGAAPIVAGVAALVRSAHPDLDAANVINRIIETARLPEWLDSSGIDSLYGHGLFDAYAAVTADVALVSENPMGSLAEWIEIHREQRPDDSDSPDIALVVPPLPPADALPDEASRYWPSYESILYGTVPLAFLAITVILFGLGVSAAARRIVSARKMRSPRV